MTRGVVLPLRLAVAAAVLEAGRRVESGCEVPRGWRDRTEHAGEWSAMLDRFPSCWSWRVGGVVLLPPWFDAIVQAWGADTLAIANVPAIVEEVRRYGPEAASMLLVKLAQRFDETGEV